MKKILRKIHLWLSVPTGIVITLVCFSGAMLVFEKELTEAVRPEVYFVQDVKEEAMPMQELMEKVEDTLPDSVRITGVTVSSNKLRTYQVSLSKPRRASIYVNQYT
ncbi:MAG: PepSY domain-containing protein, partial [Muribaculaceae bacterium]